MNKSARRGNGPAGGDTGGLPRSVDLIASVVAFGSVRTADKPADTEHLVRPQRRWGQSR